jgi:hypothetical protein
MIPSNLKRCHITNLLILSRLLLVSSLLAHNLLPQIRHLVKRLFETRNGHNQVHQELSVVVGEAGHFDIQTWRESTEREEAGS